MSTPSEHAFNALEAIRYCPVMRDEPDNIEDALRIDTHAIAPAVAERDRRIAELVDAGGLMRAWLGKTEPGITSRWDDILAKHGGAHD